MTARRRRWGLVAVLLGAAPVLAATPDDVLRQRGGYLAAAAGCATCHTEDVPGAVPLAGGRRLKTRFGVFVTPNITPDPVHGIGRWSEADFIRALRQGLSPAGSHYYPSFPYAAYTRMQDDDLRALWAWLKAQPPAARANAPHELDWYVDWRRLLAIWKAGNFAPGPRPPNPSRPASWNRGAYLAEAVVHCGECHSPRGRLGGVDEARRYAGTTEGPEGDDTVPNITPDRKTGIGRWRPSELVYYLETGATPDGDYAGGMMAEVVDNSTAHLTRADREAIAEFIFSLPPVEHAVKRAPRQGKKNEFEY